MTGLSEASGWIGDYGNRQFTLRAILRFQEEPQWPIWRDHPAMTIPDKKIFLLVRRCFSKHMGKGSFSGRL